MSVPHPPDDYQHPPSERPETASPRAWLNHFPDPGPRCPRCGTPRPPFHERLSGLLDLALQTREAASILVEALEAEGLP